MDEGEVVEAAMNPLFAGLSNLISGLVIMFVTNRSLKYSTSKVRTCIYAVGHVVGTLVFSAGLLGLGYIFFGDAPQP